MFDRMTGDGSPLESSLKAKDASTDGEALTERDGQSFLTAFTREEVAPIPFKFGLDLQAEASLLEGTTTEDLKPSADALIVDGIDVSTTDKAPQNNFAIAAADVPVSALASASLSSPVGKLDLTPWPLPPQTGQALQSGLPVTGGVNGIQPQTTETGLQVPQSALTPHTNLFPADTTVQQQATRREGEALADDLPINPAKQRLAEEANMQLSRTQRSRAVPDAYKFVSLMPSDPSIATAIVKKEDPVSAIPPPQTWESARPAPQTAAQPPVSFPQPPPFHSTGRSVPASIQMASQQPTDSALFDRSADRHRDTSRQSSATDGNRTPAPTTAIAPAGNTLAVTHPAGLREASSKEVIANDLTPTQIFDDRPASVDKLRAAPALPPQTTPQRVTDQIAQIAQNAALQRRDVLLNPKELGRVRLNVQAHETTVHVAILVERPETLDLIRRHINELSAEFRDLGYRDVSFEFGQGNSQDSSPSEENASGSTDTATIEAPSDIPTATHPGLQTTGSLDLRI